MLDDEIIYSLFTSAVKKETNECHQAVSKEERFMNDASLLETRETTILYYITKTITKQAQIKSQRKTKS